MQNNKPTMHTGSVKLFITDRVVVWLSIDDVEWAMRHVFTQNHLKEVPLLAANDPGVVNAGVPAEQRRRRLYPMVMEMCWGAF